MLLLKGYLYYTANVPLAKTIADHRATTSGYCVVKRLRNCSVLMKVVKQSVEM